MLSPQDAISGIYKVTKLIYDQVQLVKANKKQCQRLSERVRIVEQAVKDLEKAPEVSRYEAGLNALHHCLTNALAFIEKFSASNRLERYLLKTGTSKEQFAELNDELQKAVQQLNLGLTAQQLMNQEQDKADREADAKALLDNQKEILAKNEAMLQDLQGLKLDAQDRHDVLLLQIQALHQQFANVLQSPRASVRAPSGLEASLQIPYYELAFEAKIAEGSFGKVYKGRLYEQTVAIKLLTGQLTHTEEAQFKREVQIMSRLRHPHITQFLGSAITNHQACLVMEYLEKGALYEVLGQTPLTPELQKQLAVDIAKGLHYLHSQTIWHRDLKSANILVDAHFKAKISDFGLSKIHTTSIQTITERSQAPKWQAPECFARHAQYTDKSDIYSYGVILWEIFTGQRPYAQIADEKFIGYLLSGQRETIPAHVPEPIAKLIDDCWQTDPLKRPALPQIIKAVEAYQPRPPSPSPEERYHRGLDYERQKDYSKAYQEYQQSAAKGYFKANTNVGLFFLRGLGGAPQDKAQAYQSFLKGANNGHLRAMVNVAMMLEYGDGIQKDIDQACYWYQQAAEQGDKQAHERYQKLTQPQMPSYRGFDASAKP